MSKTYRVVTYVPCLPATADNVELMLQALDGDLRAKRELETRFAEVEQRHRQAEPLSHIIRSDDAS